MDLNSFASTCQKSKVGASLVKTLKFGLKFSPINKTIFYTRLWSLGCSQDNTEIVNTPKTRECHHPLHSKTPMFFWHNFVDQPKTCFQQSKILFSGWLFPLCHLQHTTTTTEWACYPFFTWWIHIPIFFSTINQVTLQLERTALKVKTSACHVYEKGWKKVSE
jgi:hypothetical protein